MGSEYFVRDVQDRLGIRVKGRSVVRDDKDKDRRSSGAGEPQAGHRGGPPPVYPARQFFPGLERPSLAGALFFVCSG